MRRYYVDSPAGQIHVRYWSTPAKTTEAPIVCLPPAPFSGVAFDTLAPLLAKHRDVYALDYPGYGMSDRPSAQPAIADYAESALTVAKDINTGRQPLVFLGFHTGCLVGIESAIRAPDTVGELLLIDVPYFGADRRRDLQKVMGATTELRAELTMLESDWTNYVSNRLDTVPLSRAYQLFVDQAGAGELRTAAFHATLNYDCDTQLPMVTTPTYVVATKAGLYEESVRADGKIPNSRLIKLPEIKVSVLEQAAPKIAETVAHLHAKESV